MKRRFALICGIGLLILFVNACKDDSYDLDKLDTTMSIGGENVIIPIGKTEPITLSSVLKDNDDILKLLDGVYSVSVGDTIEVDIEENLKDVKEALDIKPVTFNTSLEKDFGKLDTETLTLDPINIEDNVSCGLPKIDLSNISMPSFQEDVNVGLPLEDVKLDDNQKKITFPESKITGSNLPFTAPSIGAPTGAAVLLTDETVSIGTPSGNVNIAITLPDGTSNYRNFILNENAVLVIKTSLKNNVLSDGAVKTNISLNPSDIFSFAGQSTPLTLNQPLNKANNYSHTYRFPISALNIASNAWNGNQLNLTKAIALSGNVTLDGAKIIDTDIPNLANMAVEAVINVENLIIENVTMDFNPTDNPDVTGNFALEGAKFDLPDQVNRIKEVKLETGSTINLQLHKKNMGGLDDVYYNIKNMTITFPQFVVLTDSGNNRFTLTNHKIQWDNDDKATISIKVKSLNCTDDSFYQTNAGKTSLIFGGNIDYTIQTSVGGSLSTKEIPADLSKAGIDCKFSSNLKFASAEVTTKEINEDFKDMDFDFTFDVPSELENYGTVTVTPKGTPAINMQVTLPQLPLTVDLGTEGIEIQLPKVFTYKNVPSQYHYNAANNSIKITSLQNIAIPIDKIVLKPEKVDGKLVVKDKAVVSGGVRVASGSVSTTQIEDLDKSTIKVVCSVPSIVPETIALDHIDMNIDETSKVDINFTAKELAYLDKVEFKDTYLNLEAVVSSMPKFGTAVNYEIVVKFPAEFDLDKARVNSSNELVLKGDLSTGGFKIDPLKINGVNFDYTPKNGVVDLDYDVVISGDIAIDNPSVDLDQLSKTPVKLKITGGIPSFTPTCIYGKIDYKLDDVKEEIDLAGELPDFMNDKENVLDIANPNLRLVVNTNLGIPIKGSFKIMPYRNGRVADADIITFDITLAKSESVDKMVATKIWVGNSADGVPSDFTFVKADLSGLLKNIPDKIEFALVADTDLSQDHVFDVQGAYKMDFQYQFIVPLEFGKDLQISLRDTLNDIPSILSDMINESSVGLVGTVENSFPLQMEMNIQALDASGSLVPIETNPQVISACSSSGQAVTSELNVKMKGTSASAGRTITGLILDFKVTSGNLSGVPVTDKCHIIADIKAALEGGIIISDNDKK